jgi:hypothetical protein
MTTRIYCTLFDKNYLYQGVALYQSLQRHTDDFRLYALCMDSTAYDLLGKMQSASMVPVHVDELLSAEIAQVRARTTHGQFCWVCQPLICEYVLDHLDAAMVTYLEADSLFFSDPEVLFAELGGRSVSLVPHNYSLEFDNSQNAGLFCIQFNSFRDDAAGRRVLSYWRQRSFEYDRAAPLLYPGQTCLDDWPLRFEAVAVIQHRGAGVAPWNVRGYVVGARDVPPTVDGVPVVFYHYHQYARRKGGAHDLGSYPMSREVIDTFYRPYVSAIRQAERTVRALDPSFNYRRESAEVCTFGELLRSYSRSNAVEYLRTVRRKLRGRYNVYADAYFSA